MRTILILVLVFFLFGLFLNLGTLRARIKKVVGQFKIVHYAWIILFIAILNFGKIESTSILVSNSAQIILVVIASIIIGLSLITRLRLASSAARLPVLCLIVYGFSGVLSGAISPFPEFTIYKAVLIIISALACMLFLSYRPQYESAGVALDLSLFFYWILFISFLLGGIISPEKAFSYKPGMLFGMMSGWIIDSNPNALAMIAGVAALVCINRLIGNRPIKENYFYLFALPATVVVLIMAQSRTCIVAIAVSMVLIFFKKNTIYQMIILLMILALVGVVGVQTLRYSTEQYIRRGQTDRQLETWSGRIPAWRHSWEIFKKRPVVGYGMAAGVRFGNVSGSFIGSHLHSSYFEVLLNSGLIGFIPWIICLFLVICTILKRYVFTPNWFTTSMKDKHIEITTILVFLFVRSVAGTTLVVFDHSFMLYIALIAYAVSIKQEDSKAL